LIYQWHGIQAGLIYQFIIINTRVDVTDLLILRTF
jgi:hypothetical protein